MELLMAQGLPLPNEFAATRGNKFFELSNLHLVITDQKKWKTEGSVSYYAAQIKSISDYYPFGMVIPSRSYEYHKESVYRYVFNGKETDGECGQR
jgi:hypothetical protein